AVAAGAPGTFEGRRYYRVRRRVSGPAEDVPTAAAVAERGRRSIEVEVDVADADAVIAAIGRCRAELGDVDVLVNNAGIVNNIALIAEMTPEAWDHEMRVNLTGMFHTVRAAVPAMAERGWGRVVNMASVAALSPGLGQPAYAAS